MILKGIKNMSKTKKKIGSFDELLEKNGVYITGYEIVKGYGNTEMEAINDLHSTLL